jgi:hypothetical protein
VDDLAALRFDGDVDAKASAEVFRPCAGRHHGVPARDPLARDTDGDDGAMFDDEFVDRRGADLELVLLRGAQQCRGQQSTVDPRAAAAVDRALDVGKRRKQRPGLVRRDLGETVILAARQRRSPVLTSWKCATSSSSTATVNEPHTP